MSVAQDEDELAALSQQYTFDSIHNVVPPQDDPALSQDVQAFIQQLGLV